MYSWDDLGMAKTKSRSRGRSRSFSLKPGAGVGVLKTRSAYIGIAATENINRYELYMIQSLCEVEDNSVIRTKPFSVYSW